MGVIDRKTYTLSCEQCGIDESATLLDKGSGWSGPSWQSSAIFSKFNTEWSQSEAKFEPTLVLATCKKCGNEAKKESRHS